MAGLGETLGNFIRDNGPFIVVAAAVLAVMAGLCAQNIYMATGTETLVSKDSPVYRDIDYYNENFQATTFLIFLTSDNVMSPEVIEAMDKLESQLLINPKIERVTGLYKYLQTALPDGIWNKVQARNMLTMLPVSGGTENLLLSGTHHTIMTVQLRGDVDEKEEVPLLDYVKSTIRWVPMPAGTSAAVTGETAMMLEVQGEMMRSMAIMMATAIIFMILALWFSFSHSRWRLLPLPIVLVGVIYTGGVMGITGVPLTMVSMAVFPILIGLGVEYAIQFQNRMMEELSSGKVPGDAVVATVKHIGPPVLFSVMTTCLGFVSILSTPVPMIRDFGMMCLIGIVVCFLTALFLLLAVLLMLSRSNPVPAQKMSGQGAIETVIERAAETTTRHPGVILVALIAMIAGYALDPSIGVEFDSSTFAPQDLPSVVLFRSLNNEIGFRADDVVVQVKADDVTDPEVIKWVDLFSVYEKRNNPDVIAVSSLATLLKVYNNDTVPDNGRDIQAVLSRMPETEIKRYVDSFGTTGIIRMTVASPNTDKSISLLRQIERDLEFLRPSAGVNASLGGQSQVTLLTLGSLTGDRMQMTFWSMLLVLAGLFIAYRGDWVRAVVPVIAVVIVTGLSCIVMILLHMKYTPLSVTLGALTIGIGIDFSILHMERYFEEKAKGHHPREAMRIATAKIGNAIFSSATTVIAGFGALVMSNFSILSNFGVITIIDFIMALCSAFLIMPPLLVTLDTWRSRMRGEVIA